MNLLQQNNGEGFWVSMWNSIADYFSDLNPDTVFSVLVSIGIFSLGWLLTVLYEKRKETKRLKERVRFLRGSLESRIKAIEKQSKAFSDLATELKDLKKRNFNLNIVTSLSFKFFSTNLLEDVHKFLERHEERSFFITKELSGAINSIEVQIEHIKSNYNNFVRNAEKHELQWNQATNQVFRFNDQLIKEFYNSDEKDDFFNDFNTIIAEWVKERDDLDTEHMFSKLVKPLREFCLNNLPDHRARKILPYLHEATFAYENMKENRDRYSEIYSRDSEQIDTYKATLEAVCEILAQNLTRFRPITKRLYKAESKALLLEKDQKSD